MPDRNTPPRPSKGCGVVQHVEKRATSLDAETPQSPISQSSPCAYYHVTLCDGQHVDVEISRFCAAYFWAIVSGSSRRWPTVSIDPFATADSALDAALTHLQGLVGN